MIARIFIRFGILVGAATYVAVLTEVYVNYLSRIFAYDGYVFDFPPQRLLWFGYVSAIMPAFWLPVSLRRPSVLVHWFLFLLVYVPASIVPIFVNRMETQQIISFQLVLLFSMVVLQGMSRIPIVRIPRIQLTSSLFVPLLLLLTTVFTLLIIRSFGFRVNLVGLLNVYSLRSEFTEVASVSGLGVYAVHWQSGVVAPLLVALGLVSRRYLLVFLGIASQLFIYSITGFKSVLFSPVLILLLLAAFVWFRRYLGFAMQWGIIMAILAALALDLWRTEGVVSAFVTLRLIMLAGLLTGYYVEFFSDHSWALLAYSVFRNFFEYPYDKIPADLIGTLYFGPEVSANANLWADGFANFGFFGMVGATILLGLLLWLYDSLVKDRPMLLSVLVLGVPAFTIANVSVLTFVLTHGFALLLILIYFMPTKFNPGHSRIRLFPQRSL